MKRLFIVALVATSVVFTSCKETTKNDVKNEISETSKDIKNGLNEAGDEISETYNDAKAGIQSAFDDIRIPNLDDEKAEAHLIAYADYVKAQMDKGAETINNSEFMRETKAFADKSEAYLENLGKEAKASFKATMAKIDAKVDEIEKDLES